MWSRDFIFLKAFFMAHHPKTEQFIRSGLFSDLESFVDLEKKISLFDDEKT